MLVLASGSPRRKRLLSQAGYVFRTVAPEVDETPQTNDPARHAEQTALKKARAVTGEVVLGADTVVVYGGRLIGKPLDEKDAKRLLEMLSGQWHDVVTGVAVVSGEKEKVTHITSRVLFKSLDSEQIAAYVSTGEPMDKAGGYAIQGLGKSLVREHSGSFSNIIGLPLEKVQEMLAEFGVFPS